MLAEVRPERVGGTEVRKEARLVGELLRAVREVHRLSAYGQEEPTMKHAPVPARSTGEAIPANRGKTTRIEWQRHRRIVRAVYKTVRRYGVCVGGLKVVARLALASDPPQTACV